MSRRRDETNSQHIRNLIFFFFSFDGYKDSTKKYACTIVLNHENRASYIKAFDPKYHVKIA